MKANISPFGGIVSRSVVNASGTSIDFSNIPSWVKRITVILSGVSTNGTAGVRLQIGDSGGIETSGYLGSNNNTGTVSNNTAGFEDGTASATAVREGIYTLILHNATNNTWGCYYTLGRSDSAAITTGGGMKALSARLTTVRLTTTNGTDTFDAGTVNILYE